MALTARQVLRIMANDEAIAERRLEGNREVWRIQGQACGPAIAELIKRGWVWTHYPTKAGSAGINEAGRAAYDQETLL